MQNAGRKKKQNGELGGKKKKRIWPHINSSGRGDKGSGKSVQWKGQKGQKVCTGSFKRNG